MEDNQLKSFFGTMKEFFQLYDIVASSIKEEDKLTRGVS
jgi:hypothetical protein